MSLSPSLLNVGDVRAAAVALVEVRMVAVGPPLLAYLCQEQWDLAVIRLSG